MENQKPVPGVGVMIFKDGKVLLGKRGGSYAVGEYTFPGGKIEYGESMEDTVRRETLEECGVVITNIRFQAVVNSIKYAPHHFISTVFLADWESGEPRTLEPEKLGDWQWYSLDDLPEPIFEFSKLAIESYKTGKHFFDIEK